jgi:sulfatase modifying factor 1
MRTLRSATVLAAFATSTLVGCSDPESRAETEAPRVAASASAMGSAAAPNAGASSSAAPSATASPPRPALPEEERVDRTLDEQRASMLRRMSVMLDLGDEQRERVRAVLERTAIAGQGNPEISEHPLSRKECRERREAAKVVDEDDPRCGAAFMAPVWDRAHGQSAQDARLCVDRYEFPGVPCEFPVTWVSPRDAADLCAAVGKRLCDAHEWEGACAGAVLPVEQEYAFGKPRKESKNRHNDSRTITWAYGPEKDHARCATGSKKSASCSKSGYGRCGSNTYPAGSFPECRSAFGIYDQHGNVAEHMNLPLRAEELASRGGFGETEMKGSWFIFQRFEAHKDDCRWRAPDWHVTKVGHPDGHANYHLGFRCCKDIGTPSTRGATPSTPASASPATSAAAP